MLEQSIPARMRPAFGMSALHEQLPEIRFGDAVVPADEWPLTARVIRRLRAPEDRGVGDTIHRHLGAPGRWFESAMTTLGVQCGCADRRDWLNRRFPYTP